MSAPDQVNKSRQEKKAGHKASHDVIPLSPLTLPLHGMRLIEASAGTGKTFTIAALYLRLVLGHGRTRSGAKAPNATEQSLKYNATGEVQSESDTAFSRALSPREILVVTFTRAAVEELRGRIRNRLQEAANALRSDQAPSDPILASLYNEYEASGQRLRAVYVLQQAAESMDEAAIYTIHSWCQQVLQQHAFESGAGFNRRLQQDQKSLFDLCVQDYWRTFFYPLDQGKVKWLRNRWKTPNDLLKVVQNALKHAVPTRAETATTVLDAHFEHLRTLQHLCAQSATELQGWVEDVIARDIMNKTSYPEEKLRAQCEFLLTWSRLPYPAYPEDSVVGANELKWWSWQQLSVKFKKGKTAEPIALFQAIDTFLLNNVEETLVVGCIEHAAAWVQKRLISEKQRQATLHFDDLVDDVYFALTGTQGERLATALRGRFPIAMIDEFQDTDERQYSAFKAVYASAPANGLLLIGDPKQAIYGFRGADIFTYLQARHDTQGRHYSLDTNFRSVPTLVAAVNHVFDIPARGVTHSPFVFDGIPFVPVKARPDAVKWVIRGKKAPSLTLWNLQGAAVDPKTYQKRMAEHTADTIATLLLEARQQKTGFMDAEGHLQPLKAADMAILIRNRMEATAMREALAQRGVRSVYLSERDTVFATTEAHTLLTLLQAVAQPEDERSLRLALAEPYLRLSHFDLDRLQQDETMWDDKVIQFKAFRLHWQQHGVLPMLRRLLQEFEVPHFLLSHAGGERVLTNLLHLSEWLQSAASTLEGEHALIRHLQDKIRLAEQEDNNEELTLRLESDEQLLKIITIHKSKGLEYPLVFLPFVCAPGRDLKPPLAYHDADGHKQVYWEDGNVQAREQAEILSEKEQLAEDLRLFYVALTRAKHACWLGMAEVTTFSGKNKLPRVLYRNPLAWLLAGKATLAAEDYQKQLAALANGATGLALVPVPLALSQREFLLPAIASAPELYDAREMSRSLVQRWSITSYTGIVWGASESVVTVSSPISSVVDELSDAPLMLSVPDENILQEERMVDQRQGEMPVPLINPFVAPMLEIKREGMHAFPAGAEAGTFLHEVLEWAGESGFDHFCVNLQDHEKREMIGAQLLQRCLLRGYDAHFSVLFDWLESFLQTPLCVSGNRASENRAFENSVSDSYPDSDELHDTDLNNGASPPLRLGAMHVAQYQIEMEFWLPLAQLDQQALDRHICGSEFAGRPRPQLRTHELEGMLKGFIDLLCEHDGRYYVLDYKSNRLGNVNSDYSFEAMRDAVLHHRYDVQYALYTLALHRLLASRLGESYDYETHMGGAVYLFLRGVDTEGNGVFFRRMPFATVLALEQCLMGVEP